jgi:hypothetical protein
VEKWLHFEKFWQVSVVVVKKLSKLVPSKISDIPTPLLTPQRGNDDCCCSCADAIPSNQT